MTPLYGRSLRGERALGERPAAKGERISMIGASDFKGLLDCMCFGGTLDGAVFSYYVEHFPVTHLCPGKNVIMDNASPHKNEEALDFIGKLKIRTSEKLYKGYADSLELIDSKMAAACFRHCGL